MDSFLQKLSIKRKGKWGDSSDNSRGKHGGTKFYFETVNIRMHVGQKKEINGEDVIKWEHAPFSHLCSIKIHCIPSNVLKGLY